MALHVIYCFCIALHNFIAPRDSYNTRLFSLNQVILNLFLIRKKNLTYIQDILVYIQNIIGETFFLKLDLT